MLEKNLEFHTVIMRHPNIRPPEVPPLPAGFSARFYRKGDGKAWARLQTSVGEFDTEEAALTCFSRYLPFERELEKRQVYIVDDLKGAPAASATSWFSKKDGRDIGVVHALCCLPEYQSRSLGKAAAARMMDVFYRLSPGQEVWLDTQTWSCRAIGLYLELGFVPMKTARYNGVPNEYAEAVRVLKGHMRPDLYRRFTAGAE